MLARLTEGGLVREVPQKLKIDTPAVARVRIARNLENPELREGFKETVPVPIHTASSMRVELTSDHPKLQVTPASSTQAEQLLGKDGVADWTWTLRASEPGTYALLLTAAVVIDMPSGQPKLRQRVYNETVLVEATLWDRTARVVRNNWQAIAASAAPLVGGGAWLKWWRQRQRRARPSRKRD
jgi:hypothetical protein